MGQRIRKVDSMSTAVPNQPGEALRFLSALAEIGLELLAFTAPGRILQTQFTIFPEGTSRLEARLTRRGLHMDGPYGGIPVQGEDVPGALVDVHQRVYEAGVNVHAASGGAAPKGEYGCVMYLRPEDVAPAARAMGIGGPLPSVIHRRGG